VCQLRLDFQTMTGYYTGTSGLCGVDDFAAAGQTGVDPPTFCGTNTGYHMYVEFGNSATDTITLTNTWRSGGLTTAKTYNILARQISCTASWKAPTDCVQYFTGKSGNVKSYNFAGSQMLLSQTYQNCIRTELGMCAIQWKVSSTTSPDPFGVGVVGAYIQSDGCDTSTVGAFIFIPNMSQDGIQKLNIGTASPAAAPWPTSLSSVVSTLVLTAWGQSNSLLSLVSNPSCWECTLMPAPLSPPSLASAWTTPSCRVRRQTRN